VRVFITGASGFLGRALAAHHRAAGWEVRGMDLAADAANDVVAGDVARPGPWQEHAAGADVVVHTAAVVSLRLERPEQVWEANVLGTKHALDAAVRAGARRFVHFSSVTVFGFAFPDGVDETYAVRPTRVPYPDTKIASEQLVLQAHAEDRAQVTVVRPGDVYGPGSRAWAVLPVELLRRRQFLVPPGTFSPVYVDDLVAGVAAAATSDAAAGQVITLSGGEAIANERFFRPYADALGVPLPVLPAGVAKLAARAGQALGRFQPGDTDVNPRAMAYLTRSGTYSIARAERLLGWRPQVPFADGMPRTLEWLRERGLVPPA